MRDAQSLLDQLLAFGGDGLTGAAVQQLLGVAGPERVMALAGAIFRHDAKEALDLVTACADGGLQLGELLDQLVDHWRDLMLVACAGREVGDLTTPGRFREELFKQADSVTLDTVLAGLDILVNTKARTRGSSHLRTLLQMAVIRLCRLEDLAPLSQLAFWVSQPGSALPGNESAKPRLQALAPSASAVALPEGKKKTEPVTAPIELTAENLAVVWPEILAQIGGVFAEQVKRYGIPAIFGPKSLVIVFPAEYNAFDHSARAENVLRVESALRERTGQAWTVRLEKKSASAQGLNGSAHGSPAPRVRPQEAMQQVPILARAMEVLNALPIHLDPGFGAATPPPAAPPRPTDPDEEEA
jgi:DNA polymerase-3 subunit gamma/tau